MNVLYISYDGLCDPLGKSQIIPYIKIIEKLSRSLFIISFEKKENIKFAYSKNHQVLKFNYNKFFFIKLYDLILLITKTYKICKKKNIQVIHARSHIPCLVAFIIKYFLKIKIIFDFRGLWIDERFEMGLWKKNRINQIFYKFFKKIEMKFIKNADHVIVLTKCIKKELINLNQSISVIPCVVDYKFFNTNKYKNKKKIFNKYKLCLKKKVFCYMGSLGGIYETKEILRFFKKISNLFKNIQILIITNNPDQIKIIQKKFNYLRYINIKIYKLELKNIPEVLTCVDFAFNYIKNGLGRKAQSPTRVSEFLSMGIPVFSSRKIGDLDQFFSKMKFGSTFNNYNDLKLQYLKNYMQLCSLQDKNLNIKKSKMLFDLKIAEKKYFEIYEKLK